MKVNITKDYWDGSKSQSTQVNLDGTDMKELMFIMMEAGVAGVTITKVIPVTRIADKINGE